MMIKAAWKPSPGIVFQAALVVIMVLYYGSILANSDAHRPNLPLPLTFNSMLDHLLHGRFDVDPAVVGAEGFARDGRVYAYWGIFNALLRLPLLPFPDWQAIDVTMPSCLVAVCVASLFKIRAVTLIRRHAPTTPASGLACDLVTIYFVLGGSAIAYLKSSIFQENVSWAAALDAIFVYCAIRGLVTGHFSRGLLSWMALDAGLALLTRVSAGVGLYSALGLLLLALAVAALRKDEAASGWARLFRFVFSGRVLLPVLILGGLAAIAGVINYYRWGNPATFLDYRLYLTNALYPGRAIRAQTYGLFNLTRIPFGLCYYLMPIWVLRGSDGHLLFEAIQTRLLDAAELPPGSFLVSDLFPIVLTLFLAVALVRKRAALPVAGGQALALAAGLATPILLMLTAITMTYRYRMEFYPEIDFLALLSLYTLIGNETLLAGFMRWRRVMIAVTILTVAGAHGQLMLYDLSPFGPSQPFLRQGVLHFYQAGYSHQQKS